MQTLINPKNGDKIESDITDEEARQICSKVRSHFANDLSSKCTLSEAQKFWLHKIALDNKNPSQHQLESNLEEFIRKFGVLQFKMNKLKNEELIPLGKVVFRASPTDVYVWSGERCVGTIVKDQFQPRPKCQPILIAQVKLFSTDPVLFMEVFGKATGVCCICGRLLTNEGSVERGIGPICAENYGL